LIYFRNCGIVTAQEATDEKYSYESGTTK